MESDGRLRVMHLISGLERAGAERMLVWSARYHDRGRFRLAVVSMMSGGELSEEIEREGVRVFELGLRRGRITPGGLRGLFRTIREFAPRILQGHMFHANMLARSAKMSAREVLVLNTLHIDQEPFSRRFLNASTSFLCDGTLAFSRRVADTEKGKISWKRPVRLIPYGIEIPEKYSDRRQVRRDLGLPETSPVWIAVGRLTRQKGYFHLLEAFSRIEGDGHDPYLLIVGSGEDGPAMELRIAGTELENRVRMVPNRPDAADLMGAADFFVLPSLWEGGPLVVLEAMAARLPVVATDVGDVSSMVLEGETGSVVPPGRPDELYRAMVKMMNMGSEAEEFGRAGRERVKNLYDFRSTQREVEKYYLELTGAESPWSGR